MLRTITHELVRYLSFIYPQCRYVMVPHTIDKVHETLAVVCETSVGQYNKFSTMYIILDPIFVLHALKTVGYRQRPWKPGSARGHERSGRRKNAGGSGLSGRTYTDRAGRAGGDFRRSEKMRGRAACRPDRDHRRNGPVSARRYAGGDIGRARARDPRHPGRNVGRGA